jgi:hypothetical protein
MHKNCHDNLRTILLLYLSCDAFLSPWILLIIFYYKIICFKFLQSLKKEVDWDRSVGDDRSTTGESSSDYRHPHEPVSRCFLLYFLNSPLILIIVICWSFIS